MLKHINLKIILRLNRFMDEVFFIKSLKIIVPFYRWHNSPRIVQLRCSNAMKFFKGKLLYELLSSVSIDETLLTLLRCCLQKRRMRSHIFHVTFIYTQNLHIYISNKYSRNMSKFCYHIHRHIIFSELPGITLKLLSCFRSIAIFIYRHIKYDST